MKQFFLGSLFLLTFSATLEALSPAQAAQGEYKLERGGKVSISNPHGSITINGWDGETVQATVTGKDDGEPSEAKVSQDGAGRISITVDSRRRQGEKQLTVKLPRYAEIESASAHSGDIEITDIEGAVKVSSGSGDLRFSKTGPLTASTGSGQVQVDQVSGQVNVSTGSGDINLSHIGPLEARAGSGDLSITDVKGPAKIQTGSGDVSARNIGGDFIAKLSSGDLDLDQVTGLVNVTVTSGNVKMHHGGGDVRVNSISGDITVECVKGHVELNSASGSMSLSAIGDDVDATTTSGDVDFAGKIRVSGRYRLKSTSGHVHMTIPAETAGFTATLSSYSGEVETDFPLTVESPLQRGAVNRRVIGRFGDGQTQIVLDSFSTGVKLSKDSAGVIKDCP